MGVVKIYFCIKINILKGNFDILYIERMASHQKLIEVENVVNKSCSTNLISK